MHNSKKQLNKSKNKKKQFMDFLDVLVVENNRYFKENKNKIIKL